MTRLLLLFLLFPCFSATAATSTTLGGTNALKCYRESQVLLASNPSPCSDALRNDELVRRDRAATYSNRGIIYANMDRLEDALNDHSKAIELMPKMAQAWINRGNIYYRMHRFEDALAQYRKATELVGGPAFLPYFNSGVTLVRMKRYEEAAAVLETALEFSPGMSRIEKKLAAVRSVLVEEKKADD